MATIDDVLRMAHLFDRRSSWEVRIAPAIYGINAGRVTVTLWRETQSDSAPSACLEQSGATAAEGLAALAVDLRGWCSERARELRAEAEILLRNAGVPDAS